ncbi:hypothetical protein ACU4GR_30995 [Methylobacterium oryzae CBMB20]|uniref:Uncharacterized protein n=1 Tax=Methylobacterium oryzae TaxID=334852 RepID=A0ABU7TL83_9HYPH
MIVLIAAALVSGLATAAMLAPVSALAALIIAPLAASASAILACIFIAWRNTRGDLGPPDLETQADAMVAVLCDVAQQGKIAPVAAPVRIRGQRSA